ncbi:MAG: bifunctional hydroxymethylpyrimidine kinase/phosphomethylpyrimidine kinase [Candidatus Hydrogenedens sp.]
MVAMRKLPRVLTIAGSDSGGGAGIQADIKTMCALNCYGMSAITAITAQNTLGVYAVHPIPPDIVKKQIEVVLSDIGVDAIKTGMLWGTEIITVVHEVLEIYPQPYLVIDPVLVAKSGDLLLHQEAISSLLELLIPHAWLITPNLPELKELTGIEPEDKDAITQAGYILLEKGVKYVLVKGGHGQGEKIKDYLFSYKNEEMCFVSPRVYSPHTHGTGCTLSSAIACYLARGLETEIAVEKAIQFVHKSIETAPNLGKGHGPLNHLWMNPEINCK